MVSSILTKMTRRVTGPLWGEFTGHRWIPFLKASDAARWRLLWTAPEQTVKQTIKTPMIWDAIALIMTSLFLEMHIAQEHICCPWSNGKLLSDEK